MTLAKMLSTYCYGLPLNDRECYSAKLPLLYGVTLDLYGLASCLWLNVPKWWSSLHWPDIYTYLIETLSIYIRQKLKAYHSLDNYSFVVCGHVLDELFYNYNLKDVVTEMLPKQKVHTLICKLNKVS